MVSEPRASEIVRVLHEHGVEFIVVGGMAARLYGAQRLTEDFDSVIKRTRENLQRVAAALSELGAAYRQDEFTVVKIRLDGEQMAQLSFSRWSTTAGRIDLLESIPAESESIRADYDELLEHAQPVLVAGQTVMVASLAHIIRSKEAIQPPRPKDLEALPELRRIAETSLGATEPMPSARAERAQGLRDDRDQEPPDLSL